MIDEVEEADSFATLCHCGCQVRELDALQTELKVKETAARSANAHTLLHLNQASLISLAAFPFT